MCDKVGLSLHELYLPGLVTLAISYTSHKLHLTYVTLAIMVRLAIITLAIFTFVIIF